MEAGSPRSRYRQIRFLVRSLFLACRRLPVGWVLSWQRERDVRYLFLLTGHESHWGTPFLWSHLNLITFQRPHLQIPSLQSSGFQSMNLRGNADLQTIMHSRKFLHFFIISPQDSSPAQATYIFSLMLLKHLIQAGCIQLTWVVQSQLVCSC